MERDRGLGTPLRVVDGGDARPGLDSCLRALRTGDVLVVWTLDRLGRTLAHLVNTVQTSTASTSLSKVFVRRGRGTSKPRQHHSTQENFIGEQYAHISADYKKLAALLAQV